MGNSMTILHCVSEMRCLLKGCEVRLNVDRRECS